MQHTTHIRPFTSIPDVKATLEPAGLRLKLWRLPIAALATTLAGFGAIIPGLTFATAQSLEFHSKLETIASSRRPAAKQFAGKQFVEKPVVEKYLEAEQFIDAPPNDSAESNADSLGQ